MMKVYARDWVLAAGSLRARGKSLVRYGQRKKRRETEMKSESKGKEYKVALSVFWLVEMYTVGIATRGRPNRSSTFSLRVNEG